MKKRTLKLNRETIQVMTGDTMRRVHGGEDETWVCTGSCGTAQTCGCLTGACNTFVCGTQEICI